MNAGEKTRVAMILTFATLLADDIGKMNNTDLKDKAEKVKKWSAICLEELNIKLTPVRQNNIYKAGEKIGTILKQCVADEDGKVSIEKNFAACSFFLDFLVGDMFVKYGVDGQCWDSLRVVSDTLSRRAYSLYPEYEECGVKAYEMAYDILERIR